MIFIITTLFLATLTTADLGHDGSIADRCTPLAIIRPAESIWVAKKTTAWADISGIHLQLSSIAKAANTLMTQVKEISEKIGKCTNIKVNVTHRHRFLSDDLYSIVLFKEDTVGTILRKINTYSCELPPITKAWVNKACNYKANFTDAEYEYIAGLSVYSPGEGKAGRVLSLNNENLVAITDWSEIGLNAQPTTAEVHMGVYDVGKYCDSHSNKNEVVSYKTDKSIKYICLKPIITEYLSDTCKVPFKSRIENSLSLANRTTMSLIQWANDLLARINALPIKQVQSLSETTVVRSSHAMTSIIHHIGRLYDGGLVRLDEETEDKIRVLAELANLLMTRVSLDNKRNLIIDNIKSNSLPTISIHIYNRVQNIDGKHYIYGDIYGPDYDTFYLSLLDRLLDRTGKVIIFNYLISGGSDDSTHDTLEYHPRESHGCEQFGSQLVCRTPPVSGAPDAVRCART